MTWNKNHPARSQAFLSRLHDGDLSPAERAHFEVHRAHCGECRTAAADYERALSLFRSARSSPPPADLANRVLRKVQASGPSRRTPFGNLFSIDLRWAGAFAAALLVLLVATPIVLREQKKAFSPDAPIAVALGDRNGAPPKAADDKAPAREEAQTKARSPRLANAPVSGTAPSSAAGKLDEPQNQFAEKRNEKLAAVDAEAQKPSAEPKTEVAAAVGRSSASTAFRQAPAPPAAPPADASAGGEGARDQVTISAASPTLDRPARFVVQPFDSLGAAPALLARPEEQGLNELRGRSFVLSVDGQGHVVQVHEASSKKLQDEDARRRDGALAKEKDESASTPLKSLRFQAGERPRRLLVRVE